MKYAFSIILGCILNFSSIFAKNCENTDYLLKTLQNKADFCQKKMDDLDFVDNRDDLLIYYMAKKSAYVDCIDLINGIHNIND